MGYLRRKTLEWLPAVAFSAAAAALAGRLGRLGLQAWAFEGLCRELVAGTTEGRQALVGSGWFPPLPTLAGAIAAAFAPHSAHPWAAAWTIFLASAVALYTFDRTLARAFPGVADDAPAPEGVPPHRIATRRGRALSAGICRASFWILGATWFWATCSADPTRAAIAAMGTVSVCKFADWWESGGLSDLVKLAFALAGLALCGFPSAGIAVALLLLLPLPVLFKPALRGRFAGVAVLGATPAVYAILVWCLMCWLVLGDFLYPLRGAPACVGWNRIPLGPYGSKLFAAAAVLGVAAVIFRRRDHAVPAFVAAATATFAWHYALCASCLRLDAAVATVGAIAVIAAMARLAGRSPAGLGDHGPRRTVAGCRVQNLCSALALGMAAFLVMGQAREPAWNGASPYRATADALLAQVASDVAARTPYGRIFVCGYGAPGLLKGGRPEPFVPCLDPFLPVLRKDYERQDIFLLVPEPAGTAAWESLYWRYPGLYGNGARRLLFVGDYDGAGSWRLYELISAPTEDQLQEWRAP